MRRFLLVTSLAAIAVAACDASPEAGGRRAGEGDRLAVETFGVVGGSELNAVVADRDYAQAAPAPPPPAPAAAEQPVDVDTLAQAGTLLAYSYATTLELPARNVRPTLEAHQAACRDAGVAVCQLLSSTVNENGPNFVGGSLIVRAAPTWLAEFRAGLAEDAREAGGRITSDTVSAEDLTRQIVDTEARLRARRVLRERLENLLANQEGDVGELLAVERELARVQGEIDSSQSQLEMMRRRVEMSRLSLSYASAPIPLSRNAFAPLGRAINGFFEVFAEAAGLIVNLVAFLLPFVIVGAPLLWLLRRWWRARRARKAAAPGS